ncbi:hypothetical protein [Nocardia higoensis]|uniref:hypothetical protein n=1 Tax=Nocardia higoensis TaxID=228599 RepID=UPI0002D7991D|nr:hypothetical protein [Nocardia higoensis]
MYADSQVMDTTHLRRMSAVVAATAALTIGAASPAWASNYLPIELPLATTAAHGLGCAGDVWAVGNVYPDGDVPGVVDLQLKGWLKVLGVPAPWCSVTPTVHWRNLDTGASGSGSAFLGAGNGFPFWWLAPQIANLRLAPGPGRVEFTLTTDLPHAASVTTFTVY